MDDFYTKEKWRIATEIAKDRGLTTPDYGCLALAMQQLNQLAEHVRTAEGFQEYCVNMMDDLSRQFVNKNKQYGDLDPLANFKLGALLTFGSDDPAKMYETLKGYLNKHVVHVYGHDITGNKIDESWRDIAIYAVIALCIHEIYYCEHAEDMEDGQKATL